MSNSTRKPYYHYASFDNKTQRFFRNKSRRSIRRKGKSALQYCLTETDIESADYAYLAGTSFKDGFDEWTLPSDGHQVYLSFSWCGRNLSDEEKEEIKKRTMRK